MSGVTKAKLAKLHLRLGALEQNNGGLTGTHGAVQTQPLDQAEC